MKMKYFYGLTAALAAPAAFSQIVINEIDSDTPSSDTAEFVELYNAGSETVALTGHALVFFNGSNDLEYQTVDLDAASIAAGDFLVIGNAAVPNVDIVIPNGTVQNGADGIGLYSGATAAAYIAETETAPLGGADLVDAVVYGTGDPDATGLLTAFGETTQYDESANLMNAEESVQRNPDGSETFVTASPTPGATNDRDPLLNVSLDPASVSEGDGTGAIFAEITVAEPVVGELTITISISDATELEGPLTVTILDGEDFVGFDLDAVDDALLDGVQSVTITASANGFEDGVATAFVADDDAVVPEVVINEMQIKGGGLDPQYVEIYNFGSTPVDIAGWTVVAYGSDPSRTDEYGIEMGSFEIPDTSPLSLPAGGFYLVGDALFESIYGISPDLQAEPGFDTFDITMILFDDSGIPVFSVLSHDGNDGNQANNAGSIILPDITVVDGTFSPSGFYLETDGGSTASILEFTPVPSASATPGTTNTAFIERLRIEVDGALVSEGDGVGAVNATITRVNNLDGDLTVSVVSSDTTELSPQASSVTILDGEATATLVIDAVDDLDVDGSQSVTLTATAAGFVSGSEQVTVTDDDGVVANLVINELLNNTSPGTDTEFIELYNPGPDTVDIAGYIIRHYESDDGSSTYGNEDNSAIVIPSDAPVLLATGEYYLIATPAFIAAYPAISVDLNIGNDNEFENSAQTVALFDPSENLIYSAFMSAGNGSGTPNIAGNTSITVDISAEGTGGFALNGDGATTAYDLDTGVPSSNATPGASNNLVAADYTVTISDCSYSAGQFVINFAASGSSDIYVSTDLTTWAEATNGAGVASGTYTDTAPPTGKAFYQIQEAGTPAP